jgi:hypothetical protein
MLLNKVVNPVSNLHKDLEISIDDIWN